MSSELERVIHRANPVADTPPAGSRGHDVQFYRSEAHLVRRVSDFLADGLKASQPVIVIATPARCDAFARELRARGLDTEELFSGREVTWLDARATLDAFMERGRPHRELFMATVGAVFERVLHKRNDLIVRGYGEMVDLLAKDGNFQGAVAVEALWNELAARYSYSLLCGYAIDNFFHESGAQAMRTICEQHSRTLFMDGSR